MKTIKYTFRALLVAAVCLLSYTPGKAQTLPNSYFNIDWQYNVPINNNISDKSSGWGMNFEGGYYVAPQFGIGGFISYHTNNQYIPRETFPIGDNSAVTTDQQHSVFQLPFGITGRYRFTTNSLFEPYVAAKLGANYARLSSDYYVVEAYDKTWGFYASPEIGVSMFPFPGYKIGLHVAAYYSYATNKGSVLHYSVDGLNNFGIRVGLSF